MRKILRDKEETEESTEQKEGDRGSYFMKFLY